MTGINWNVPVPKKLDELVERAVAEGNASSKAELIRFAVLSYLRYLRENGDFTFAVEKSKEVKK